mmetsp:Transcript_7579/g.23646  ORF Transcript_7579/g.23646 Transcript_7579/m.23646 type:complete len:126 (-) Transcript_7579:1381-1758(-)
MCTGKSIDHILDESSDINRVADQKSSNGDWLLKGGERDLGCEGSGVFGESFCDHRRATVLWGDSVLARNLTEQKGHDGDTSHSRKSARENSILHNGFLRVTLTFGQRRSAGVCCSSSRGIDARGY